MRWILPMRYLTLCLVLCAACTAPKPKYEILDFPKHLCDFEATDASGESLAWSKEGKNRWRLSVPGDGVVKASYRIYANRRDVASSRVDGDIAFVYTRYYRQLHRGFTEEEFWSMVDEVAGRPMPDLRRMADTTEDIDYDSYLRDAGLRIDGTDWSIRREDTPDSGQERFLRALNLL